MLPISRIKLTILATLVATIAVAADDPDIGQPDCSPGTALLRFHKVQAELGMTADQIQRSKSLLDDIQARSVSIFQSLRGLEGAEQDAERERLLKPLQERWEKGLAEVLTPKQVRRLRQLDLQPRDLFACQLPSIAAVLKLSKAQVDGVQEICTRFRADLQQDMDLPSSDQSAAMSRHRERALRQLREVVTKDQQALLKELVGEPFDFYALRSELPIGK